MPPSYVGTALFSTCLPSAFFHVCLSSLYRCKAYTHWTNRKASPVASGCHGTQSAAVSSEPIRFPSPVNIFTATKWEASSTRSSRKLSANWAQTEHKLEELSLVCVFHLPQNLSCWNGRLFWTQRKQVGSYLLEQSNVSTVTETSPLKL
jgi:hypothetical protein